MTATRTHRPLIAWMLFAFILFNGLACSFGHGQMMSPFSQASAAPSAGHHDHHHQHAASGHMDMNHDSSSAGDGHAALMKLAMNDCAFAGTLVLAILFMLGLAWRKRTVVARPSFDSCVLPPPRHLFPGISPQAP